jgi:ATP-dependent RNA helicase DeaD
MSASAPDGSAVIDAPSTDVVGDTTPTTTGSVTDETTAAAPEATVDPSTTDTPEAAADTVADATPEPVAGASATVSEPTPESASADALEALASASKPDPRTRDRPVQPKQETPVSTDDSVTFADLQLHPELLKALSGLGYEEPTPIQRETIRPLIAGKDVLGQAATGTGKTAAFALPMLHTFGHSSQSKAPRGLVLVPTRELATQVAEAFWSYGKGLGIKVLAVYGGEPIVKQLKTLHRGVDVVVATPGRAKDLIDRGALQLGEIRMVVLDEADEMLDMGFQDDIETILGATPQERQTVLFSATMPSRIDRLARTHQNDAVRIQIAREATPDGEAPKVRQAAYVVARHHKATALCRVLDQEQPTAAIVFCRTRAEVDEVAQTLNGRGYTAEALHGGMDQTQRSRTIDRLKNGSTQLIVATDVAARGLDIDNLTHVVNYDVPSAPEAYVHRIGRVGRAGREGVAITFAQPREHRNLKNIERLTRQQITIAHVPTVADLRTKRLEETKNALRESLQQPGDLAELRAMVESLAGEFDVADVAAAALKLAHAAVGGPVDEEDIPQVAQGKVREHRGSGFREGGGSRRDPRGENGPGNRRERRGSGVGTTRIFVGAGREARMRPQDLVGAIAGESQLSGRDIGAIQINDRFSLVEVPEAAVDGVIEALRGTTIKGRKPKIRREV